jgi:hypothetical protein
MLFSENFARRNPIYLKGKNHYIVKSAYILLSLFINDVRTILKKK